MSGYGENTRLFPQLSGFRQPSDFTERESKAARNYQVYSEEHGTVDHVLHRKRRVQGLERLPDQLAGKSREKPTDREYEPYSKVSRAARVARHRGV